MNLSSCHALLTLLEGTIIKSLCFSSDFVKFAATCRFSKKTELVAFVHSDEVDSPKPELATKRSRVRHMVSHEFMTKMKEKFREMALQRMAAEKEVCVVDVGHRYYIKCCRCSLPTLLSKTKTVISYDTLDDAVIMACNRIFCRGCISKLSVCLSLEFS